MTYEMHLLDEYVRGQIAGRAEGRAAGIAEGQAIGRENVLAAVKWLISQGRSEEVENLKDSDFLELCLAEAAKEATMETAKAVHVQ